MNITSDNAKTIAFDILDSGQDDLKQKLKDALIDKASDNFESMIEELEYSGYLRHRDLSSLEAVLECIRDRDFDRAYSWIKDDMDGYLRAEIPDGLYMMILAKSMHV